MKNLFLDNCMKIINSLGEKYDDDSLNEIKYGLEVLYLAITKMLVILVLSYILGIFKATILFLLFFSCLRTFGFGLHASKSWICWSWSIFIFLVFPYLCSVLIINQKILFLISGICIVNLFLFAPADTKKRPLIHQKRRIIWKLITLTISLIFTYFIYSSSDHLIQNTMLFAMLIQSVLVNPLVYKFFKIPYNNYKVYS